MDKCDQFRHAKQFYSLVDVLGVGDEPHHLGSLLLVDLGRNDASEYIGLKPFLKHFVIGVVLLLAALLVRRGLPVLRVGSIWSRVVAVLAAILLVVVLGRIVRVQ